MINKSKLMGLRERMARAENLEELFTLAGEARNYDHASRHTIRRWANTLARKEAEFLRG